MKKIIFCLFFLLATSFDLPAQTSFFEGKTARILVGFSPGGSYDLWARLIARHMGRHIPGNPNFVVQNMTGGGSMVAANYVYKVAKPDGLTIAVVTPGLYIEQLAGEKRFSLTGPNLAGLVRPREPSESFTFAQTRRTKRSRIYARRQNRPSAGQQGSAPRVIIGPGCSARWLDSS